MSTFGLKPVFGAASFGRHFNEPGPIQQIYETLKKHGVTTLDTARLYGDSEKLIGQTHGAGQFIIDSKTPGGFGPEVKSAADIVQHAKDSVERTATKQLDIFYIHAPHPELPLEELLRGIHDAHQKGYFKRFGLSNYTAADVQHAHEIAQKNGWILPTVYQGNYSAVARRQETELFPILRKLGISFYAYSPVAGGFLTKTAEQIRGGGSDSGRFAQGERLATMYNSLYNKPSYLKALDLWGQAADKAHASRGELAYRWVAFDSPLADKYGDAIIFGSSKMEQVEETLGWLKKGSVGAEANALIDEIWKVIEHEAPLDNYNSFIAKAQA